jgi:phage gpG-like protein
MAFTVQILPEREWKDLTDPRHWSAIEAEIQNIGKRAVEEGSTAIRRHVVSGIVGRRSTWPQLSYVTRTVKGNDTPLIQHGDLLASIDSESEGQTAFVGVMKKQGSHGQDLETVARIMEEGAVISVTPKMREWFKSNGFPLRASTTHITVPARPFLEPAVEESYAEIDDEIGKAVDKFFSKVF